MKKTTTISVKQETLNKLKELKDKTNLTQSELVEIGVGILYSKFKRRENENTK